MILSKLLENGNKSNCCIHCLMDKCQEKEHSNKSDDSKLLIKYINNPSLIPQIKKDLSYFRFENKNLDEKIKKNDFIFTTCLFCFSKDNNQYGCCKNSREGRSGSFIVNNKEIHYCYPDLKNVKHRLHIGLHIDFSIDDNKISYSYIQNKNSMKRSIDECNDNNDVQNDINANKNIVTVVHNEMVQYYKEKCDMLENELKMYKKNNSVQVTIDNNHRHNEEFYKKVLLENISLKTHIEYLRTKYDNLLKNNIDDQIQDSFYKKVLSN